MQNILLRIKDKLKNQAENAFAIWDSIYLWRRNEIAIPFCAIFVFFLCILYVISPIDLIPDFFPVFGYVDDIIIIAIVYNTYKFIITIVKQFQKMKQETVVLKQNGKIFKSDECVICLNEKPTICFHDCNHLIVCEKCSIFWKTCPFCREKITKKEKISW